MPKRSLALPLLIEDVTAMNLLQALEQVRGCLKTTSMLWLRVLGIPVLSGVVVDAWSREASAVVRRFVGRNHFSELLLRIDKRNDRWTLRRGGYLIRLPDIPAAVEELKREEMLALLLEPASPYRDEYSLAGVSIPEQEKLIIEVVGPGFDASDILRGDLQPHERWEARLNLIGSADQSGGGDLIKVAQLTREQYVETVRLRLAKTGARRANPAFPDTGMGSCNAKLDELIQKGISFLKERRETLLLRHAEAYIPISSNHVRNFAQHVQKLLSGLSAYGIHLGSSSFAASVIPKRGLTFWDFFPARKQEAAWLNPSS